MSSPEITQADWKRLQELRGNFISNQLSTQPYWRSPRDLLIYDMSLARRIYYKLKHFFSSLSAPFSLPAILCDWGCGSGAFTEAFLEQYPHFDGEIYLFDHSKMAMEFSYEKLSKKFPKNSFHQGTPTEKAFYLISHVINEVDLKAKNSLRNRLSCSDGFFWIEAATKHHSQLLVEERNFFLHKREKASVAFPCPHLGPCELLRGHDDWCHFFAEPPMAFFTERFWSDFKKNLSIDLKSLPYSAMAIDFRKEQLPVDEGKYRIIGSARHYKGYSLAQACTSCAKISEKKLSTRNNKALIKEIKKTPGSLTRLLSEEN